MKLFYNPSGTVKVLPVSVLPVNAVWNGGFPYTPEGSLLVSIVSAKPTDTVSNGGFIQELWGGVCAGYDTPSIWIGGLAITSYGALCLDVDGGIVTDGPVLNLPLTHSLIPTRGDITPTFTRASTATFTDWEGVLRTVPSGCARFEGARMVQNLCDKPEDFSVWSKTGSGTITTGVEAPDGTMTAATFTAADTNEQFYRQVGSAVAVGASVRTSTYIRRRTGTGTVSLWKASANGKTALALTSEWQRLSADLGTAINTNGLVDIEIATIGDAVDVWHPQFEDVTGQADQTASEYVSVGVESAPAYHGSMVDGVKCYDTDRSGNPISTSGSYPLVGYVPWEARTNLCLQSETFDTTWVAAGGAITVGGSVVAPNGATVTKSKISENSTSTVAFGVAQNLTKAASALAYSFSGYFKQAERTWIQVVLWDNVSVGTRFWYNLATGSVGSTAAIGAGFTAVSIQIAPAANGFYRCIANVTTNTGTTLRTEIQTASGDGASGVTGVVGNGIYAWGAQVELGSFATPYIPTTTVAVARNADQLTYSGAALSSLSTEGTILVSASVADFGNTRRVFDMNTGGTSVPIYYQLGNGFQSFHDGAAARSAGVVGTAGVTAKLALAYGGSTGVMSKNGANQTAQTFDGSFGTITSVSPGGGYAAGQETNGPVTHIYIWNRKLSDSELRVITS